MEYYVGCFVLKITQSKIKFILQTFTTIIIKIFAALLKLIHFSSADI